VKDIWQGIGLLEISRFIEGMQCEGNVTRDSLIKSLECGVHVTKDVLTENMQIKGSMTNLKL
jgi:hypothetical protein